MHRKIITLALATTLVASLYGCASTSYNNLPIQVGTIIESTPSQRQEFTPSLGGAAAGAAIGGLAGNRVGKGNGRKVATVIGLLSGAAVGGKVAGTTKMVEISLVTFRDNDTHNIYKGAISGRWQTGMAVRYSLTPEGKFILR